MNRRQVFHCIAVAVACQLWPLSFVWALVLNAERSHDFSAPVAVTCAAFLATMAALFTSESMTAK